MQAETITRILLIAVGGAFGAVARYLINISPLANLFEKFPFPTFFINITGSFLIGFLLTLFTDKFEVSENIQLAVIVGFLGAFTTFSTFELETFGLIREKHFIIALLYLLLSILLGFISVLTGVWLAKKL